jgi:hypothetical protein
MRPLLVKAALWAHTVATVLAGLCLYWLPQTFGPVWPWALPPLAARFMGSLLIGGGLCSAITALLPDPLPLGGTVLLGVGDALIVSVGLLDLGEIGLTLKMIVWVLAFMGMAGMLWTLPLVYGPPAQTPKDARPLTWAMKIYFAIHLSVVVPVGLSMYLLPDLAQKLWPWSLAAVNVRLLGAFFIGAAFLSIWSLRQHYWRQVQPLLTLYGVFTTLTTLASIIHFGLFNPARIVTWAFFALYIFVAMGAWIFLAAKFWNRTSKTAIPMLGRGRPRPYTLINRTTQVLVSRPTIVQTNLLALPAATKAGDAAVGQPTFNTIGRTCANSGGGIALHLGAVGRNPVGNIGLGVAAAGAATPAPTQVDVAQFARLHHLGQTLCRLHLILPTKAAQIQHRLASGNHIIGTLHGTGHGHKIFGALGIRG